MPTSEDVLIGAVIGFVIVAASISPKPAQAVMGILFLVAIGALLRG